LNTDVYRSYFNRLFGHKYDEAMQLTDADGRTDMLPISWDYRFSNLCNFKCRMCGDMLSSAWESEQRQHDMINWSDAKNGWMRPEIRSEISKFQDTKIEQEFAQAVEQHRVEEIYWVGGEPLMYEQHWRYMKRIIELGDGPRLYARYNTNLSRVDNRGINLYRDILGHVRDWQICASLDGTGATGEYIRTGLDYEQWRRNFALGLDISKNRRQMRIDFTLTLPGLFEVRRIQELAREFDVDILAKVVFGFSPDIIMSPLALPRNVLDRVVDELCEDLPPGALKDILLQLKQRPTFEQQWPDTWRAALIKGKRRILKLENIRGDSYTMADIIKNDRQITEWYENIATD
jgi:hypothetical protein